MVLNMKDNIDIYFGDELLYYNIITEAKMYILMYRKNLEINI